MKAMRTTLVLPNKSRQARQIYFLQMIIVTMALLLGSCKTNDDSDIIFNENFSGEELAQSIIENRNEAIQNFIIDGSTGGEIQGEDGTILNFGPNAFVDSDGNIVSGNIDIQLVEIYDKSKMLLTKMPTNGKRPNGDVEALKSGGEFFVNATQEGTQLALANGFSLFAPAETIDNEMRIFTGINNDCNPESIDCDVVWEEEENGGLEPVQREAPDGGVVTGYGGFISNFGWTNIDRWYNDPRPKTILYVDVPEGFDNTNCNVYISYDGESTALALLDIYDPETALFSEHYGQIPIGLEVHFIFVSVQDGNYTYAIQGATIVDNHIENITTTTIGTEAELVSLINNLP